MENNFLYLIKGIYKNPIAINVLNGKKLNAFPQRSETSQGCLLLPLLFKTIPEILASAIRQEKAIKYIQAENEVKLYC